jgi:hypothetical protein
MSVRSLRDNPIRLFWLAVNATFLFLAFGLVSPFLKIDASDYGRASEYGLRLALGLLIFIMFVGKWSFDVFSPQGLSRKVSRIKTAALIAFNLFVVSFIIYIVAQAAALYLQSGINQDNANTNSDILTLSNRAVFQEAAEVVSFEKFMDG